MKEGSFENRGDVAEYGKERGLLEQSGKPEVIISRLKSYETDFGYNPFKAKALEAIIDNLSRKKRGKNPAVKGSFEVKSVRDVIPEKRESANPKEYLDMVLGEFVEQTALETEFIENFIKNNDGLDEDAKKFMVRTVASHIGPWFVREHVSKVSQDGNKITVTHKNGEAYYYMA